ncbi:APO protein 2 [Arachis hypogaea]|nr:APO protein 2 [Arachis hypogaea]
MNMTIGTLSLPTGIAFPTPTDVFMLKPNLLLHLSSLDYYQYSSGKIRLPVETRIQLKKCFRCKLKVRDEVPQNANFPRQYARKEKKPFSTPIVELRRAARERLKMMKGQPRKSLLDPKEWVACEEPYTNCLQCFSTCLLLKVFHGKHAARAQDRWCSEIHVGPVGHPFTSCKGAQANLRKGLHEWMKAHVEDMIIPIEAYHLEDRLGKRIPHEERFSIPRIPAMVELCIQAGVEIPEFPTKRRR